MFLNMGRSLRSFSHPPPDTDPLAMLADVLVGVVAEPSSHSVRGLRDPSRYVPTISALSSRERQAVAVGQQGHPLKLLVRVAPHQCCGF